MDIEAQNTGTQSWQVGVPQREHTDSGNEDVIKGGTAAGLPARREDARHEAGWQKKDPWPDTTQVHF